MDKLTKLKNAHQACVTDMQALLDGADDALSTEQQEQFDALKDKAASLKSQIANYEQLAADKAVAARIVNTNQALPRQTIPDKTIMDDATAGPAAPVAVKIPAKCRRWAGRLDSFKGPDAEMRAYRAGMWLAATLCGSTFARNFCNTHGIMTNQVDLSQGQIQSLHQEGVNTAGGYLVFDEFENDIIRLVEDFGLVRQIMKNVPMMSDVKITNRRTGGISASFIGEGAQISSDDMAWDQVKLIAKKLAAISTSSNELLSDAIISIANEITREIALAFATKEDLAGLQGDGTSTHGGITGIAQRLSDINGVDDGGGLILGAGDLFSDITDAELMKVIGQVPNFPGLRPEWVCSKPFYYQVMARLIRAAGGVNTMEMEGGTRLQYGGFPVNLTSGTAAMPVSDSTKSQIFCLFGDYRMSSQFGDRAGITIATSTDATVGDTSMFDTDSFAIRGIERFDINNHDLGTATAAGPVVGFISAAS
jgi:HK97 family phage major capsid protein